MEDLGASDPRGLGRYQLRAVLGEGGMGRVFLATAPDGQLVAIKRVHAHLADDQEFRRRFRREVAASRRVTSDHTASVVDADTDAAVPWLASEFVHGPSLNQALAKVDSLPEEAVLRLAAGLAAALHDIHQARLVHRDLSPANVLLANDGPKVIDFGIVRAVEGQNTTRQHTMHTTLTTAGMVVGAPGFMSPEQAEGNDLTSASDVFSLGTTLLVAATGENPFQGTGIPQTMYRVVHSTPDLGGLPDRLRQVIEQCLAKLPGERPTPAQLLELIGPLDATARPWPAKVHRLTERELEEVSQRVPESNVTTVVAAPPVSPPTPTLVVPPQGPPHDPPRFTPHGPFVPPVPTPPPTRTPGRRGSAVVLAVVAVLALILTGVLVDSDSDSGGEGSGAESSPSAETTYEDDEPADTPPGDGVTDDEPSDEPEPEPDPIADAEEGDCFSNSGTMDDMELEPTACGDGTFETVKVIPGANDPDDCEGTADADWGVVYPSRDVGLCLSYQHTLGSAYHASSGDCVYGDSGKGTNWNEQECQTGNFTVLSRHEDTLDSSVCDGEDNWDQYRYFSVENWSELNVMLCLSMNYPDDVARAPVDTCMHMTGAAPDFHFEYTNCDSANVIITGRTGTYNHSSFCGNHGWTTWRPNDYPDLAYTVCFRNL